MIIKCYYNEPSGSGLLTNFSKVKGIETKLPLSVRVFNEIFRVEKGLKRNENHFRFSEKGIKHQPNQRACYKMFVTKSNYPSVRQAIKTKKVKIPDPSPFLAFRLFA